MCAVIGAVIYNAGSRDFDLLRSVFIESQIRGLHATGISYVKGGKIHTEKRPVPAEKFLFDFLKYLNEDGNLYLIGHCRYSTSDLEYNQPISTDKKSIAHNGVITQESAEKWKSLYGADCVTKNDSELVLHSTDPLKEYSEMSMAVCELYSDKSFVFYRNGKRPIYYCLTQSGIIVTSTSDIARRSGLNHSIAAPMNTYMRYNDKTLVPTKLYLNNRDFQL